MEGLSAYGSDDDDDDNQNQSITPGNSTSTTTAHHDIPLETTTMNNEGLPVTRASTHGRESDRKVQGHPFKKFKTRDPATTNHRQVGRMNIAHDIRHGIKQDAGDLEWKKLTIPIWTEEEARNHEIFVRNEPHVRGNWAGLVYLRVHNNRNSNDTDDEDEEWERDRELQWNRWNRESYHHILCQSKSPTGCPKTGDREPLSSSSMPPCLVWHDEPHISLTRTFYVQAANIPSFLQHLQQRIATWASPQQRLELHQRPLIKLVNDEQSRSFWAWPVVSSKGPSHHNHDDKNGESNSGCHDTTASPRWLTQWVHDLDDLLQNYQQPPYYDPPTFHASFASYPLVDNTKKSHKAHHSLGHRNKKKEPLDKGQHNQMPFVAAVMSDKDKDGKEWRSASTSSSSATWEFEVTHVYCRIGHEVHCFALEEPLKPR